MATEYKLSYTASEIDERLRRVDENTDNISKLSMPEVTEADNGKVLMVVNGKWAVGEVTSGTELPSAEEVSF